MTVPLPAVTFLPMVENASLPVRYPEFAERVREAMARAQIDVQGIVNYFQSHGSKITYEMVRRYTLGQAMPRQEKMAMLSDAIQSNAQYLQYGGANTAPRVDAPTWPFRQVTLAEITRLPAAHIAAIDDAISIMARGFSGTSRLEQDPPRKLAIDLKWQESDHSAPELDIRSEAVKHVEGATGKGRKSG